MMNIEKLPFEKSEQRKHLKIYVITILLITISLILLRIIFYFFEAELSDIFIFDLLINNRDRNFETNYYLMKNGIIDYYQENPFIDEYGIYLYFWYFIFYPFSILPIEVSIYVWDCLRLFSTIYIAININKLNLEKRDLSYFFIFSGIGYLADMYLNNTNWIIQLFLYESYIYLEREKKLISGIFFSLATFKVIIIIFPFIFLIIKRIRLKDLLYYFLPLLIISIPYIIFPEYFLSMISNWFKNNESNSWGIFVIFIITWRLIQPAHLMFISIILVIIIINIKKEKLRKKLSLLLYSFIFTFWIIIWVFLLEIALLL